MPKLTYKWDIFGDFQTIIPDRSLLIGQKLVENAEVETFKWDIFGDFHKCVSSQGTNQSNEFPEMIFHSGQKKQLIYCVNMTVLIKNKKISWVR